MTRVRRVLLVEDNPLNQQVASAMLRKLGCEVTVASGGLEGIALGTSGAFDLIFMDCQMPGVDGLEATHRIRSQQAGGGHTPIVALTANALQGDRERCLEAGMDDYLTKPLSSASLRGMLERWPLTGSAPPGATGRGPATDAGLDEEVLAEIRELDDGSFLAEVIGLFYTDGARLTADVRRAVAAGAMDALVFASHTLKSCSGGVGARAVRELCTSMERRAREEQRLPSIEQVAALERAFEDACVALEANTGIARGAALA